MFGQWEVAVCALPAVSLLGSLVFWVWCLAGKIPECWAGSNQKDLFEVEIIQ